MKINKVFTCFVMAVAFFLAKPSLVLASFEAGTLVKTDKSPVIYYIASDNRRYAFPDERTFYSWNKDFSAVKLITTKEMGSIPDAKKNITVRPGVQLVKFPNGTQVYAVDGGATLYPLNSTKIAKWYYGASWPSTVKTLSLKEFGNYKFGKEIGNDSKFSKTKLVRAASTVNDELMNRNVLLKKKTVVLKSANVTVEDLPTLKSLTENLKANFQPSFNPSVKSYKLNAAFEESVLILRPELLNAGSVIDVNGTVVENKANINLQLTVGLNIFDLKLKKENNKTFAYHIEVVRADRNNTNTLKAISENLVANFTPRFNPGIFEYILDASYTEEMVVLKAAVSDTKATYKIINVADKTDVTQYNSLALKYGKNEFEIKVRAENGAEKIYKVTINRRQFPTLDALDLVSIGENLKANFSPKFNPNMTKYFLRALDTEELLTITAKAKNSKAFVYINGTQTNSKIIDLEEGETEVNITVKIAGGYEKTYTITIDK